MTDLETELLNRVVQLSTKLAQKEEFIANSEYAYSDQEEIVGELNCFLQQAVAIFEILKPDLLLRGYTLVAAEIDKYLVELKAAGLPLKR